MSTEGNKDSTIKILTEYDKPAMMDALDLPIIAEDTTRELIDIWAVRVFDNVYADYITNDHMRIATLFKAVSNLHNLYKMLLRCYHNMKERNDFKGKSVGFTNNAAIVIKLFDWRVNADSWLSVLYGMSPANDYYSKSTAERWLNTICENLLRKFELTKIPDDEDINHIVSPFVHYIRNGITDEDICDAAIIKEILCTWRERRIDDALVHVLLDTPASPINDTNDNLEKYLLQWANWSVVKLKYLDICKEFTNATESEIEKAREELFRIHDDGTSVRRCVKL